MLKSFKQYIKYLVFASLYGIVLTSWKGVTVSAHPVYTIHDAYNIGAVTECRRTYMACRYCREWGCCWSECQTRTSNWYLENVLCVNSMSAGSRSRAKRRTHQQRRKTLNR